MSRTGHDHRTGPWVCEATVASGPAVELSFSCGRRLSFLGTTGPQGNCLEGQEAVTDPALSRIQHFSLHQVLGSRAALKQPMFGICILVESPAHTEGKSSLPAAHPEPGASPSQPGGRPSSAPNTLVLGLRMRVPSVPPAPVSLASRWSSLSAGPRGGLPPALSPLSQAPPSGAQRV